MSVEGFYYFVSALVGLSLLMALALHIAIVRANRNG